MTAFSFFFSFFSFTTETTQVTFYLCTKLWQVQMSFNLTLPICSNSTPNFNKVIPVLDQTTDAAVLAFSAATSFGEIMLPLKCYQDLQFELLQYHIKFYSDQLRKVHENKANRFAFSGSTDLKTKPQKISVKWRSMASVSIAGCRIQKNLDKQFVSNVKYSSLLSLKDGSLTGWTAQMRKIIC